jgi:hypothetical protein
MPDPVDRAFLALRIEAAVRVIDEWQQVNPGRRYVSLNSGCASARDLDDDFTKYGNDVEGGSLLETILNLADRLREVNIRA